MSFTFVDANARSGGSYQYLVQTHEGGLWLALFETNVVTVPLTSLAIERVSPNPFNPRVVIEYRLAHDGPVALAIYDVSGSLVRTLVNEPQAPGRYTAAWSGVDGGDTPVASGLYFVRLTSNGKVRTQKALLAK
jgi:hypothetical protein